VGSAEALCHPYFGAHGEHVLRVPAQIQVRLDEEANQPPIAVGNPSMTDDKRRELTVMAEWLNSLLTSPPRASSAATSPTCFTR
jgi:hypothetical protein